MDFDMFFSSQRWTILDILARKPSSPLEISQEMGTSVSYVSQQLRLLEAANLVVKERTGNSEKGKPRMVFSLPREMMHVAVLIDQLPAKKLIYLTNYHKLILKIWLLENPDIHYLVEKLYWRIEEKLDAVDAIVVTTDTNPHLYVVSDSAAVQKKVVAFDKEEGKRLSASVITPAKAKRLDQESLQVIYDPHMTYNQQHVEGAIAA